MPLLGPAAMLLTFDIVAEAIEAHDDWHTHEHLPERLSIPGFLRGTRWTARGDGPRYLVLYEVESLETLSSPTYLERLNNPTAWTREMMPHYRGMTRGLCSVVRSHGHGTGHFGLLVRFKPASDAADSVVEWLGEKMPALALRAGLGGIHLLKSAIAPPMTAEQSIRGTDARPDWALLATAYSREALRSLAQSELSSKELEEHGTGPCALGAYETAYTLCNREITAA